LKERSSYQRLGGKDKKDKPDKQDKLGFLRRGSTRQGPRLIISSAEQLRRNFGGAFPTVFS
jgi:hypothetical protein